MKITKTQLKRMIREALKDEEMPSLDRPSSRRPDMDAPGWGPNDSQNWDDQERQELSDINRAKKEDFLERVALDWYKEFEPAGAVSRWNVKDSENDERIIDEALSDCYDKLTKMMNY